MNTVVSGDGTHIAYWCSGAGVPLLLVHGATADHSTTWRLVSPRLEQHFTVYTMDRRGRGASGDAPDYALLREAEDIAALVDMIGQPVYVLGHSFGALCAFEAALLTPNITRLVLYEGVPIRGANQYPGGLLDRFQVLHEVGDYEGLLIALYRDLVEMAPQEIELLRSQTDAWNSRLRNAVPLLRELRADEGYVLAPERFQELRTPTLMLVGGDSPHIDLVDAEAVASALPNAKVAILPGQGHIAMYTDPDLFVDSILPFLAKDESE